MEHLSGEQSCRLYEFLDNNGGYQLIPTEHDGDCCFGAMRRGTTWPYEVADAHVRRMVLKAICNFPDFFFELYRHSLAMTYGLDRDSDEVLQQKIQDGTATPDYLAAQRLPGPFSFVGYLKFLSNPSTYADVHILMAMSMIWQLRITCLYVETLHKLRFRHHKRIAQADLLFVVCSELDHFVSAGKQLHFLVSTYYGFVSACRNFHGYMIFNPFKVFLNISIVKDSDIHASTPIHFISAHTYLFSVKYKNRYDEEGHKFVDYYWLQHAPVEKLEGYMLKDETRGIYKKEAGYEPERE